MTSEPLYGCALGLSADNLSAWRDGALDSAAKAHLDAHIVGCAACRRRLTDYDAIAQRLRAIPTPAPIRGFGRNPRIANTMTPGQPTPARRSPIGRRQALGGLGAVAVVALLLFAFTQVFGRLGIQSPPAAATSSPTTLAPTATAPATATTAPTATPAALPILPTTTIATGACGKYFPATGKLTPANGLVVTQESSLGNLSYPGIQIPSSQPAAPMAPPAETNTTFVVTPRLEEPGGGFVIAICNPSSQAHTVSAAQVTLAKMTPYTSHLNAWQFCDGAYYPVGGYVTSGGCGGSDLENEYLHAPFAANAPVGATVTATQTSANMSDISGQINLGPLPVRLKPGQAMTIEVGVTQPSAPGYYTYSIALTVDGASTGTVAYSPLSLLAPVARQWNGAACKTSAMQALIAKEPKPTANTAYICPVS